MTTEEYQTRLLKELGAIRELLEAQNERLDEIESNTRHPDIDLGWDTDGKGELPSPRRALHEIVLQLLNIQTQLATLAEDED
jgi:hypothetical protein